MTSSDEDGSRTERWTLVVPVKSLDSAKSRLSGVLDPADRRALVVAMATDVVDCCSSTPAVDRVLVVSSDPGLAGLAEAPRRLLLAEPGPRPPGPTAGDSLNTAVSHALTVATGPVAVVTADLPELRPDHLEAVLAAARAHRHSVVRDHRGTGTTMALWSGPGSGRVPRFGRDSASRYLAEGGAVDLTAVVPDGAASRDVDTPSDLAGLFSARTGPATSVALERLRDLPPSHRQQISATMVP